MLANGSQRKFDYPPEFKTLPEYTKRAGEIVTVVRPLTEDEAQPPDEENGFTQMYLIRDESGWEGHAWEEELVDP